MGGGRAGGARITTFACVSQSVTDLHSALSELVRRLAGFEQPPGTAHLVVSWVPLIFFSRSFLALFLLAFEAVRVGGGSFTTRWGADAQVAVGCSDAVPEPEVDGELSWTR